MAEAFIYRPPLQNPVIQHWDADCVVVNKPSGLLSVPGRGEAHQDSVVSRLWPQLGPVLVVHRLDMDTSGLLVFARHPDALRHLSQQFAQRQTRKTYVAIVHGLMSGLDEEGEVDLPLITDWPQRPRQKIDHQSGKPALTKYKVLSEDHAQQCTRVQLHPITGRSHQLRVHMMALGHPICGDRLYGPACPADTAQTTPTRLLLHAQELGFRHPRSEAFQSFKCLPEF